MFAVIKTGGKQYKVAKDDIIIVEKLDAEELESLFLKVPKLKQKFLSSAKPRKFSFSKRNVVRHIAVSAVIVHLTTVAIVLAVV